MKYKIVTIILTILFIGVVFAEYLGGRLVHFTDRFYVETDYWGKIDCFQFPCLNGTCLYCLNGNYRSGLVYMQESSNSKTMGKTFDAINISSNLISCNYTHLIPGSKNESVVQIVYSSDQENNNTEVFFE